MTPPAYQPRQPADVKAQLALSSFAQHMTSESWQLQLGLAEQGYQLCGRGLAVDSTKVRFILSHLRPDVVVVADKREWDPAKSGCFDQTAEFHGTSELAGRPEIFRVTILKDAHQDPDYHRRAHEEIGTHAWIVFYHPETVARLCRWVRPEHLVRTYHSLDLHDMLEFSANRSGCLLSGVVVKRIYPLRLRLMRACHNGGLPDVDCMAHPGYHAKGCQTPKYLKTLARYKVSICTTSIYGYALRKIIESTAAGCRVITDLPAADVLPMIDSNLVRVPSNASVVEIRETVRREAADYDTERQAYLAGLARGYYDYRRLYGDLAEAIDQLRSSYGL